jgi:tRNA 2-thiouridine synthesizing protein A
MARHLLDARGLRCPWPALRLARMMRHAAPGDEVVMTIDDAKAEGEVEILSRENGWSLARQDREGGCVLTIVQ